MSRLSQVFPQSLATNASRTALIDQGESSLSFAELAQLVDVFTATLKGLSVGAGDRVGICLHKRAASVASVLAIIGEEAAYVPLDVLGSVERMGYMLADCGASVVIVENELARPLVDQLACTCDIHTLDTFEVSLLVCDWGVLPESTFSSDLAMILYTSGSTGVPKGVQITNQNAMTFVQWSVETFSVSSQDVCASIAPFHFDLSVFDLFVSLQCGAAILLLNQKQVQNTLYLSSFLSDFRVTICYTTPTVLKMLLNFGRLDRYDHGSIRLVLFAGEVFPVAALNQLRGKWSQAAFYNLYGPTETNVITYHPVPLQDEEPRERPYPIGLPCPYAACRILLDSGEMVETRPGVQGELIVAGSSVTPGYVGHEAKNRQAFLQDHDGSSYYKTGDFVRVNDAGELEFLMRRDRMVKRRGYRIELDEIECVLNNFGGVSELAVTVVSKEGEAVIIACFCPGELAPGEVQEALKRHCLDKLPAYFLPDHFIALEVLPKTSSGKIDYRGLQELAP